MRLADYERRIANHEWLMRAAGSGFWVGMLIACTLSAIAREWLVVFVLAGTALLAQIRAYWMTCAAFDRGSLGAISKGLTLEDFEL